MGDRYIIYFLQLFDSIFYVGVTSTTLEQRLYGHKMESRRGYLGRTEKNNIILSNIELVQIHEIETIYGSCVDANNCELYWVSQFKEWGFCITNKKIGRYGNKYSRRGKIKHDVCKNGLID